MSNMIKASSIRYKADSKMTIDYKDRDEELQAKRNNKAVLQVTDEEFTGGLEAVVVDAIASEEDQKKKAELIIKEAENEAGNILEAAKEEAKKLKDATIESARRQGYEEGIKKANQEIDLIKKKLLDQEIHQKKEYEELLTSVEGRVADLLGSLLTRLTGILVEGKEDIILYLVQKALRDVEGIEECTISVSSEDYDFIISKKEYIEGLIDGSINVSIDPQLIKNQCIIETEGKLFDCSLDVQMDNLIKDLKMLSAI